MQRVKFLKSTSGYTDCRTLKYFVKDEIHEINDSLVKNFLSMGAIQLLEEEDIVEEKVTNSDIEDKTDKKATKRRKKKIG